MKKLVYAALLLGGLSQATGCIITSDGDPDTAQLDVAWALTSTGGDPCPAGGSVEVVSQPVGGGSEFVDIYDCVDAEGLTAPLPLGTYTVWVNVITAEDELWAQSFAADVSLDLGGEIVPVSFDILTDEGFFYATWSLTDAQTNEDLACADIAEDNVRIWADLIGPNGVEEEYVDIYDCDDYEGTTAPLPVGDYDVVVTLNDGETIVNESMIRETAITFGNELVDLGNFEFLIE